jgi:hypothetical protein
MPPRHLRVVHRQRPQPQHHPLRETAAGLRRLPLRPQHQAHRPLRFPAEHHGPMRPLSPADHRGVLRDVPRQGLQIGIPEDRQVLRLSWRARHPAGQRSALAPQPEQHRRHLRQVPYRLPPPVRRLSDTRHPPRSEKVSVPVRHLLGHDHPADRHAGDLRRAHRALAAPIARIPQGRSRTDRWRPEPMCAASGGSIATFT